MAKVERKEVRLVTALHASAPILACSNSAIYLNFQLRDYYCLVHYGDYNLVGLHVQCSRKFRDKLVCKKAVNAI